MELHTSIKQNKQYVCKTKRDRSGKTQRDKNGEIKRDRERKKSNIKHKNTFVVHR